MVIDRNAYHDEETMQKVYKGLENSGLNYTQIADAVNCVMNQGIVFREVIPESLGKMQKDPPLPESDDRSDRYEIAWRIWCWQEGYGKAEDREGLVNHMGEPDDQLTENDIKDRDELLLIADEVIALAKKEYQNRRAFLIEIAEETCRLADETLELVREEHLRSKPVIVNDPPPGRTWGRRTR